MPAYKAPLRDIRFWWTDEISSEYKYFSDNPDETKKILANVHEDMVGANQAMGSRVQALTLDVQRDKLAQGAGVAGRCKRVAQRRDGEKGAGCGARATLPFQLVGACGNIHRKAPAIQPLYGMEQVILRAAHAHVRDQMENAIGHAIPATSCAKLPLSAGALPQCSNQAWNISTSHR